MTYRGNVKRAKDLIKYRDIKAGYHQLCSRTKRFGYSGTMLTIDEYAVLRKKPCHYCGERLGTGGCLDRIDNALGYLISNVLPCCRICNVRRCNRLTVDESEFTATALKIYRSCTTHAHKAKLLNWLSIFK